MINFVRMRHLMKVLPDMAFECDKAMGTVRSPNMDGMPHGTGNHSAVEDAAVIHEQVMEAYREAAYELDDMRAQLVPVIPMLEDEQQRAIMRMRYLNDTSIAVIAEVHHYSERHVWRLLDEAEGAVNRMLDAVQNG